MKFLKRAGRIIADFFEFWLPGTVFLAMFLVFVFNIVMRYVFRDSQNWAQEFSVNAFVIVGLLGACAAHRKEDLVVFDLLYVKLGNKGRNVLRIISNIIIVIALLIAIPSSIKYIFSLPVLTPMMKIPQSIIFASLPILFVSTTIRSAYRLVLDVKALKNKTYAQKYNENKEALI